MKKSELRKIIRESIKEHQIGNVPGTYPHGPIGHPWNAAAGPHGSINGRYVSTLASPSGCSNLGTNGGAYSAGTPAYNNNFAPATYGTMCMTVNGGQVPQQGQKFMNQGTEQVISTVYDHSFCYGNSAPCTIGDPGCPASQNGFYNPPGYAGTVGNFPDHQTIGNYSPTPPTGCDPNGAFPGNFTLPSWITQWTNSGPFNNTTNANQPCNFICGKVTTFTNSLALNPGPAQTNMLECKLEEAMSQYVTHGCAQVNSNNCPI
mgnify:CR=1 FL=1